MAKDKGGKPASEHYANTKGHNASTKVPLSSGHTGKMSHTALHQIEQHHDDKMAHHSHKHLHHHTGGHHGHTGGKHGHGHGDHDQNVHGFHGLTTPPNCYEHGGKDGEGGMAGEGMADNEHMSD